MPKILLKEKDALTYSLNTIILILPIYVLFIFKIISTLRENEIVVATIFLTTL